MLPSQVSLALRVNKAHVDSRELKNNLEWHIRAL
jgi:hypothetical protein